MTAKEIIEQIMEYKGLSAPSLATQWGITAQAVYDMLKGKTTKISPRIRAIIARQMPEINQRWLVDGKGEMLNDGSVAPGDTSQAALTAIIAEQTKQISTLIDIINRLTNDN